MTYAQAKEALELSGITADSRHGFSLFYEHPFNQSSYEIELVIISDQYWGNVWEYMKNNDCTNEQALKELELIDRDDLDVWLVGNLSDVDKPKWINLKRFHDQK